MLSFRALRPAVVLFTMKIPSDDKKRRGQFDDAYGSGVAVASGPWGTQILTVQHVIDGASRLRATLDDKRSVPARVIAADAKLDVALVQIAVGNRPVARLGSSSQLEPGTQVGIAGYPIPDESGGPVFDVQSGAVVGLAESRFDDEKAIGFGVPIEDAERFLKHRLRH